MASPKRVIYAPEAIDELDAIWRWNAAQYNPKHADKYLSFLRGRIDELQFNYSRCATVRARHDVRYALIRRHSGGHGHVAVFTIGDVAIEVLHVFHTSQDWQGTLSAEEP